MLPVQLASDNRDRASMVTQPKPDRIPCDRERTLRGHRDKLSQMKKTDTLVMNSFNASGKQLVTTTRCWHLCLSISSLTAATGEMATICS